MFKSLTGMLAITLVACSSGPIHDATRHIRHETGQHQQLPPGSNMVLQAPISLSDGLEVIISDVIIPANATVPSHYHPGEEYVYVIEGYAVHVEEGKPDQILSKGDGYVIPPNAVHAPRGGSEGARAIVFRVHVEGMPERVLVEK